MQATRDAVHVRGEKASGLLNLGDVERNRCGRASSNSPKAAQEGEQRDLTPILPLCILGRLVPNSSKWT